jgi:PmbA protein
MNKFIKLAKKAGIEEVLVTKSVGEKTTISSFERVVEKVIKKCISHYSIYAVYEGKKISLHTENFSSDCYQEIIEKIKQQAAFTLTDEYAPVCCPKQKYSSVNVNKDDYEDFTIFQKKLIVDKIEKLVAKDPLVLKCEGVDYGESKSNSRLVNSNNLNLHDSSSSVCVSVCATVGDKESEPENFSYGKEFHKIENLDVKKFVNKFLKLAKSRIGAAPAPTGFYKTVFSPECFASLLECFISKFTGLALYRNVSPFVGKVNTKLFSEKLTIEETPRHNKAFHQYVYDGQGVACTKKKIINNGVFETVITSLYSARKLNLPLTGNGFGDVDDYTNLLIKPGKHSKKEILKEVSNGIYLTGLDGLHAGVNAITGDFSLKCEGFLIENGEISKPVKMMIVSGNFYKMLNDITFLGKKLKSFSDG